MNNATSNISTITTLIAGVGIAALTLILVLTLGGQTYALNEDTFDAISTPTVTTETYLEDFQLPDVNGGDPSADWYTFTSSGVMYANVSNTTTGPAAALSNQTFLLAENSSATGGALYHFSNETTYDSLEVYTLVNASHNQSIVTIGSWIEGNNISGHGAIAYWNITKTNISFWVLTGAGPTYTEVYNHTISAGTWYRLRATFDYDTHAIASTVDSVSIAGTLTSVTSGSQVSGYSYTNITQSYWAHNWNGTWVAQLNFDDFKLTDDISSEDAYASSIETGLKESVVNSIRAVSSTGTYLPIIVLAIVIVVIMSMLIMMSTSAVSTGKFSRNKGGNAL